MVHVRFLVLLFVVFLAGLSMANVAVEISPAVPGANSLYVNEKSGFAATVINTGNSDIDVVGIDIFVSDNLSLFHDLEQRKTRFFSLSRLSPGERRRVTFEVLAKSIGEGTITASYGSQGLGSSSSVKVGVGESPVDVMLGSAAPKDGGYTLPITVTNVSSGQLQNVRVAVVPENGVELKSGPVEIEKLDSNKSLAGEMEFSVKKRPAQLIVRVFFEDPTGLHELEQYAGFSGIEKETLIAGALVLVIVLLVGFHFFTKPNGKAKESSHGDGHGSAVAHKASAHSDPHTKGHH